MFWTLSAIRTAPLATTSSQRPTTPTACVRVVQLFFAVFGYLLRHGVTLSPVSSCLEEAVQGLDLREGERKRERESLEGKVHGTTLNINSVARCVEDIRAGWYDGSCCLCQDTPMPQCCPSRAAVATSLVLVGLQRSALPLIAAVPRVEVA